MWSVLMAPPNAWKLQLPLGRVHSKGRARDDKRSEALTLLHLVSTQMQGKDSGDCML